MQASTPHEDRWRADRASTDEPPSKVCYRARCGLCCYSLAHGDKSIALTRRGVELPKENLAFSPCRERCLHARGQATAYHRECAQAIFSAPPDRAAAVQQLGRHVLMYAYDPPAAEVARRDKWLSTALLSWMVGGVLPAEICREITAVAMRDQAVRSALAQVQRMKEPGYSMARLAVAIYARFVWFEGIRYVASVTNEAFPDHECIWSPKPSTQVKAVLVAEDHLGIREVRITESLPIPEEREQTNLWWRAFPVNCGSALHGRTDGIKLRGLREFNSPALCDRMIPSPALKTPEWSFRLGRSMGPGEPMWTRRHTMNKPTTSGYIVGLYDDNGKLQMCDFQAWSPGEDMSLYSIDRTSVDPDTEMYWFYFPVEQGERISGLWARRAEASFLQSRGWLLWGTSHGRFFPFALRTGTQDSYTRLAELDSTQEQDIFISTGGGSICEVMLPGTKVPRPPGNAARPPRLPVHRSPRPQYSGRDECVFTSASLRGVSEITVCRGGRAEPDGCTSVTGLFLRYNDGRVATVGSVRLDRLDKSLVVSSSPGWRLLTQRERRVTSVELAPFSPLGAKQKSQVCLEGLWEGTLEWWTGLYNNCWVYHVKRECS